MPAEQPPGGQGSQNGQDHFGEGVKSFFKTVGSGAGQFLADTLSGGGTYKMREDRHAKEQDQMLGQYEKRIAQGDKLTAQDYSDFIGAGGDPGVLHSMDAEAARVGTVRAQNLAAIDAIEHEQERLGPKREYSESELRLWRLAASTNDTTMQALIGSWIKGHVQSKIEAMKQQTETIKSAAEVEKARLGVKGAEAREKGAEARTGSAERLGGIREREAQVELQTKEVELQKQREKQSGGAATLTPQQRNKAITTAFTKFSVPVGDDNKPSKGGMLGIGREYGLTGNQLTIWEKSVADALQAYRADDQERMASSIKTALMQVPEDKRQELAERMATRLRELRMTLGEDNEASTEEAPAESNPAFSPFSTESAHIDRGMDVTPVPAHK